jgi:hypothetical protein
MDDRGWPVWFVGDLKDEWVAGLVDVLPGSTCWVNCAGDLDKSLFARLPEQATLVLHLRVLTPHDAAILEWLRSERPTELRLIVCFGPHVRQRDLVRLADLSDLVLPEATARDVIGRHLQPALEPPRERGPRSPLRTRVAVVSGSFALRETLVEACVVSGFSAVAVRDWSDAPAGCVAVWDVPVLEPDWALELARRAEDAPVVVLLGFADRALVRQAKSAGASACLELPYDLADLAAVLERLTSRRADPAHQVPPRWGSRRRTAPPTTVAEPERGA